MQTDNITLGYRTRAKALRSYSKRLRGTQRKFLHCCTETRIETTKSILPNQMLKFTHAGNRRLGRSHSGWRTFEVVFGGQRTRSARFRLYVHTKKWIAPSETANDIE